MSSPDAHAVATILGFGPWQVPSNIGKDFMVLKDQFSKLQDEKESGSLPWMKKEIMAMERKLMYRTATPPPIGLGPDCKLPLHPPDFWLCPKVDEISKQVKALEKNMGIIQGQLRHLAEALNVELPAVELESEDLQLTEAAAPSGSGHSGDPDGSLPAERHVRPRLLWVGPATSLTPLRRLWEGSLASSGDDWTTPNVREKVQRMMQSHSHTTQHVNCCGWIWCSYNYNTIIFSLFSFSFPLPLFLPRLAPAEAALLARHRSGEGRVQKRLLEMTKNHRRNRVKLVPDNSDSSSSSGPESDSPPEVPLPLSEDHLEKQLEVASQSAASHKFFINKRILPLISLGRGGGLPNKLCFYWIVVVCYCYLSILLFCFLYVWYIIMKYENLIQYKNKHQKSKPVAVTVTPTQSVWPEGCTSLHHKAAGLVHILHLECGPHIQHYCRQVVATISDQGSQLIIIRSCHDMTMIHDIAVYTAVHITYDQVWPMLCWMDWGSKSRTNRPATSSQELSWTWASCLRLMWSCSWMMMHLQSLLPCVLYNPDLCPRCGADVFYCQCGNIHDCNEVMDCDDIDLAMVAAPTQPEPLPSNLNQLFDVSKQLGSQTKVLVKWCKRWAVRSLMPFPCRRQGKIDHWWVSLLSLQWLT